MRHVAHDYVDADSRVEAEIDVEDDDQRSTIDLLCCDPFELLVEFDDEFQEQGIPSWAFTRIQDFIANNSLHFMWQVVEMTVAEMEPYRNKKFARKARTWVRSWLTFFGLSDGMKDDDPDIVAAKLRTA